MRQSLTNNLNLFEKIFLEIKLSKGRSKAEAYVVVLAFVAAICVEYLQGHHYVVFLTLVGILSFSVFALVAILFSFLVVDQKKVALAYYDAKPKNSSTF